MADQAITLVKDKQDIWPIEPEKYKRILLVDVHGVKGGFGEVVAGNRPQAIDLLKQILSAKGFEVEKYISPEEELKGLSQEEKIKNIAGIYAAKRPIKNLTKNMT